MCGNGRSIQASGTMSRTSSSEHTRRGGCQCGQIRYTAPEQPLELHVCHCRECQKQSSSAFGISYAVPRTDFHILSGQPARWCRTTRSGHELECFFCANCGSRLWHQSSGSPDTLNIKGGTLDDPLDLVHAIHIWTSSKLPGVMIPEGARSFARGPD